LETEQFEQFAKEELQEKQEIFRRVYPARQDTHPVDKQVRQFINLEIQLVQLLLFKK